MEFDLLSDVLDLPQVQCGEFGPVSAGGSWALTSVTGNDVSFCAVTRGSCYYYLEGMAQPERIEAGDVVVLSFPNIVAWASAPAQISHHPTGYPPPDEDRICRLGEGEDFNMLAGGVQIAAERRGLYRSTLPQVIHIRGARPEAAPLAWLVDQLLREMKPAVQPGRTAIVGALAQLLFAHSLRAYLAVTPTPDVGWLSVFADGKLMGALAAVHADPAHPWSVGELAKLAGMSRTTFSERFRDALGTPPLTYVANWRMRLAMDALRAGRAVADVAGMAGYASDRAFSAAFRRSTNTTPGAYRRAADGLRPVARRRRRLPPDRGLHATIL